MDKISIVVAVYNAEKTIKKCVDSLLCQTYKNIEIILVNDCSKDDSLAICEEYATNFSCISVINNFKNLGVSATRNNGIDSAKGQYLCFVDSDDYVDKKYIEQLLYYAKKYHTMPICGIAFHDVKSEIPPVEYTWYGKNELVSLGKAFELRSKLYLTSLANKLFDVSVIRKSNLRMDTSISMGEDFRFVLQYIIKAELSEVYAFSSTLYHYIRATNTSLMSNYGKNGIESAEYNLQLLCDIASKYNPEAKYLYDQELTTLKENFTYQIIHNESLCAKERIRYIRLYNPDYSTFDYLINRAKAKKALLYQKIKHR